MNTIGVWFDNLQRFIQTITARSLLVSNILPNSFIRLRSPSYDDVRPIQKHAGILVVEVGKHLLTSALHLRTGELSGVSWSVASEISVICQ